MSLGADEFKKENSLENIEDITKHFYILRMAFLIFFCACYVLTLSFLYTQVL